MGSIADLAGGDQNMLSSLARAIGTGGMSTEELEKFLEENRSSEIPDKDTYDLERSSPEGALRQMIRQHYTANNINHKPVAQAQILRVENNLQSYYDATNPGEDTESKYELVRFRVISDRRHYWLPEPRNLNDDTIISLYPLAKKILTSGEAASSLTAGAIVTVQFDNNSDQYSSYYDVATVVANVGSNGKLVTQNTAGRCADVKLPPLPKDSNPDTIAGDPCLVIGNVSDFNIQNIKKEAERNKKQIIFPRFPVTSGYSKMSNWGQVRRRSNGTTRRHWGIDYDLEMGDQVVAALDGKVVKVRTQKNREGKITGYGNYVVLEHNVYAKELNGATTKFYTLYAHFGDNNSRYKFPVKVGQMVKRGQKIGDGGNSGTSVSGRGGDGSHLHFEFLDSDKGVVYATLPGNKRKVSKDAETEFFRRGFYIDTPEAAKEKKRENIAKTNAQIRDSISRR